MTKSYPAENWKKVKLDFDRSSDIRFEVSDFGRIRTFHKNSNGNIINGAMINGYKIIRTKFFSKRDDATQKKFEYMQRQAARLRNKISSMKKNGESNKAIQESTELLDLMKKKMSKKLADDKKQRVRYYHALIHRLVAQYFLKKPTANHTLVAHLDYNKLNNRASNLQWMTPEENYEHQKSSPFVLGTQNSITERMRASKTTKLTVTKVMLLKKLLNQGKPIRALVKQFKVTDTQILRIKREENWADIKAAK